MSGSKACAVCTGVVSLILVAVLAVVLIATSIHKLDANDNGIIYDKLGCVFKGGVRTPGLYASVPFSRFITFPGVYKSVDIEVTCVTNDGLFVDLDVTFQYLPQLNALQHIAYTFRDRNKYDTVVRAAATSAIHSACSQYNTSDFQNVRTAVQDSMQTYIQTNLGLVNATALSTQLVNIGVPDPWNQAVFNKQQSQQDIALASNQMDQSIYQAQLNVSLAEQYATINLQTADANATVLFKTAQQQALSTNANIVAVGDSAVALANELPMNGSELIPLLVDRVIRTTAGVDIAINVPVNLST